MLEHAKLHKSTKSACKKTLHSKHPCGNATVDLQCWQRIFTNEHFVCQRPSRWPLKILIDYNSRSSHNMQACPRLFPIAHWSSLSIWPVPWNAWEEFSQSAREWRVLSGSSDTKKTHRITKNLCFWSKQYHEIHRPCSWPCQGSLAQSRQNPPQLLKSRCRSSRPKTAMPSSHQRNSRRETSTKWKGRRARINSLSMWSNIDATTRKIFCAVLWCWLQDGSSEGKDSDTEMEETVQRQKRNKLQTWQARIAAGATL